MVEEEKDGCVRRTTKRIIKEEDSTMRKKRQSGK
jgi:hypothetical protein